MKVQSELRRVETEGLDHETKVFKISQNKRMFEILSSNIYSDKVTAVIREYGCNAYDAHIAAGKADVPFQVHLPNTLEPWFAVKDYGTGLDHNDVMDLYTNYGNSTKKDENNSIGMLGLGSKSAFAYADQFTVISRFEGKIRTYCAFVDESGTPTITMLDEEDTQEVNGLEINIPVKESDFNHFAQKVKKVFFRFPVHPEIVGNIVDLTKYEAMLNGPNYSIRGNDPEYYPSHSGAFAVQGVVAYPINVGSFNSDQLTPEIRRFLDEIPIDLKFEVGQLDVAASREALNYDKFSQKNIIDATIKAMEHLPNQFEGVLDHCETLWDAKVYYKTWFNEQSRDYKNLLKFCKKKLSWKGQEISNSKIEVDMNYRILVPFDFNQLKWKPKPIKDVVGEHTVLDYEPSTWGELMWFGQDDLRRSSWAVKPSTYVHCNIEADDNIKIIIEDKPFKHTARSMNILYKNCVGPVIVFRKINPNNYQKLLDMLGNPSNVLYTSNMEEPEPEPKEVKQSKKKANVRQCFKINGFNTSDFRMYETTKDVNEGGVYFLLYKTDPLSPLADASEPNKVDRNIPDMFKKMVTLGLVSEDQELYAFNSTFRHIPEKAKNWVNAFDYFKPVFTSFASKKNKSLIKALSFFYHSGVTYGYDSKERTEINKLENYHKLCHDKKVEGLLSKKFLKLKTTIDKYKDIVEKGFNTHDLSWEKCEEIALSFFGLGEYVEKYFGVSGLKPDPLLKEELMQLISSLEKTYPSIYNLLSNRNDYGWRIESITTNAILLFIKLCEASPKTVQQHQGD